MTTAYVKLSGITEPLTAGDTVACTISGQEVDCKFLAYSGQPRETHSQIIVEIDGWYETKSGVIRPDMFGALKGEFVVNANGTACTGYWSAK